jgi:N-acetylglutamate synthase-like GNAT family acetyltransferase
MPLIKKAAAKDIPLIRQLCFAIWPQTYSGIISKAQIDYMLEMMYSPDVLLKQLEEEDYTFIIVYECEMAVGFAAYRPVETVIWKLEKIYILHNQQGKGLGKFIISYIVEDIKTKQAKALQLQVNRQNQAKDFYEKLGFKIIKTADFDIGNGYFMNDYVMELAL